MKLHFVKVNPVENMTIFIMDQVPRSEHKRIANKLMNYNNIHGEQVGFIERANDKDAFIRLQMMGGEFCGNATRSLAALMVHNEYPGIQEKQGKFSVDIEVSGMKKVLNCQVTKENPNSYFSKIEMPLPISLEESKVKFEEKNISLIKVKFEGIIHFIVDEKRIEDREKFYSFIKDSLKDGDYEAFGIMYYNFQEKFLIPLVYVRSTETLFWERSCASGTCALGAALAYREKSTISEIINQPGGNLSVSVEYKNKKIKNIQLNGQVKIVAEGILYI